MNSGPSRKLSSPCWLSITIEPVMSPGIRSGVNCTRRVSHRERAGEAAHEQRLGDAGHALHQHVAAAEQRDEQPGDRGVLADDGLGHLGAYGGQPLAARRGLVAGSVRPTAGARRAVVGRRSCAAYLSVERGQLAGQRRSGRGRWSGRGRPGRAARRSRRGAVRRGGRRRGPGSVGSSARRQPEALGEPGPGGAAQRRGGVGAVARPAVEPAAVAGRLDGLDRHRQGLGGQRAEPAGAPGDQRDTARGRARAPGRSQRGAGGRARRRRRRRGRRGGDVPDQPVARPSSRSADGRVVRARTWPLLSTSCGAEQDDARSRLDHERAVLAAEAALRRGVLERPVHLQPEVREPWVDSSRCSRCPHSNGERRVRHPSASLVRARPGHAPAGCRGRDEQPLDGAVPQLVVEVTSTSCRLPTRCRPGRPRPGHGHVDTPVVEYPGDRLGAAGSGLSGSSGWPCERR